MVGARFGDCMTAAHMRHMPVILVRRGMHYVTNDGVALGALGPEEPLLADGTNDVKENSVVMRLTYRCSACARPFRMLFMGDAGAQSEARMLAPARTSKPTSLRSDTTVPPTRRRPRSSPRSTLATR
jgi:beta-lactamase superfamily II metal-dependent hydrolase